MRLDITSLYYNGETQSIGNTPSWGTALGQERPDYPISVEGGQDVVDFININKIDFDPYNNQSHKANIKQLNEKKILAAGCFEEVYVNEIKIDGPFFLLVIEETTGIHAGRKNLKYNNKIVIGSDSNEMFYNRVRNYFGYQSCWFAYDISVRKRQLHISIIIVDENPVIYKDASSRKESWETILNDFIMAKTSFKEYLINVHKLKHDSSANEYVKALPRIQNWLIENKLCKNHYQIWDIRNDNSQIQERLNSDYKVIWDDLNKIERGWYGTPWNRWLEFIEWYKMNLENKQRLLIGNKLTGQFNKVSELANLNFENTLVYRFLASILSKPFIILTGLSGSGKTKLAQAFAMWIAENKDQYALVPVGADWTNREPLLGYPNSLNALHYVKPDSGVLDILLRAHNNYILNNKNLSKCKPYFLILDEMNLSHVERYFADFLSTMESADEIKLYSGTERYSELNINNNPIKSSLIPNTISLPKNLFIVGTVNIDETTYMFSPKVLDRANTIEFRISDREMEDFYKGTGTLNMDALVSTGSHQAPQFMQLAAGQGISVNRLEHKDIFLSFFNTLQSAGAEFGYRTANEMTKLVAYLQHFGMTNSEAYDIAIMQKLLPKLHGSRSKLNKVLPKLIELCTDNFPISLEKLERMKKNAEENGFASYAEA